MPTLKSGNGALENGSSEVSQSPGFLSSAMKRAGTILWIVSATIATDVTAQQAPNNLVPKVPAREAPVVPGESDNTAQTPTTTDIISILQNWKDKIRIKFPTFSETTFKQIVAWIALWDIKSETLLALAGAFPEWSTEHVRLTAFVNSLQQKKAMKPTLWGQPVGITKPLTAEEKKKEKIKVTLMESFNKAVKEKQTWKRGPQGNQDVKVDEKAWRITITYKEENGKLPNPKAVAVFRTQIAPGQYEIDIDTDAGGAILWVNDAAGKCIDSTWAVCEKWKERWRLNPGKQDLTIPSNATTFTMWFEVTPLSREVHLDKITIAAKAKEGTIAGN